MSQACPPMQATRQALYTNPDSIPLATLTCRDGRECHRVCPVHLTQCLPIPQHSREKPDQRENDLDAQHDPSPACWVCHVEWPHASCDHHEEADEGTGHAAAECIL